MDFLSTPGGRTPARVLSSFAVVLIMMMVGGSLGQAQEIQWQSDIEKAKTEAKEKGKLLLLHFSASWSRRESALQTFVFTNPAIQRGFSEHLVAVKIDADTHQDLVEKYGVETVPFDVAMTPDGRVVSNRKSPVDTQSYEKMLKRFGKVRNELANLKGSHSINRIAKTNKMNSGRPFGSPMQATVKSPTAFTPRDFAPASAQASPQHTLSPINTPVQQPIQPLTQQPIQPLTQQPIQPLTQQPIQPLTQQPIAPQPTPPMSRFVANPYTQPSPTAPAPPAPGARKPVANEFLAQRQPMDSAPPASAALLESPASEPTTPGTWKPRRASTPDHSQLAVTNAATQNQNDFPEKPSPPTSAAYTGGLLAPEPADDFALQISLPKHEAARFTTDDHGFSPNPGSGDFARDTLAIVEADPAKPSQSIAKTALVEPVTEELALNGKCPVTLLTQSKWVDGDRQWGCVHRNRTYIFSSENNLKLFQTDPDAYSPILAGYDPVIFKESGQLVLGHEKHGVFMGNVPHQRIVLFDSASNRVRFQEEPLKYLDTVRQAMHTNGGGSSPLLR